MTGGPFPVVSACLQVALGAMASAGHVVGNMKALSTCLRGGLRGIVFWVHGHVGHRGDDLAAAGSLQGYGAATGDTQGRPWSSSVVAAEAVGDDLRGGHGESAMGPRQLRRRVCLGRWPRTVAADGRPLWVTRPRDEPSSSHIKSLNVLYLLRTRLPALFYFMSATASANGTLVYCAFLPI